MKASNKQNSQQGIDQTSTEELIKQLENRLDWLTSQPAEDMNEEEIENILNLLDTLKPLPGENTFNPEEAFERLEKDYLHNPEKLEQASEEADRAELIAALREKTTDAVNSAKQNTSEKAMSIPAEESKTEAKSIERKNTAIKKHRRFRVLKNVGIAAAIMILVFSGLNLATYATAKKGLFDLIINRKNTMSNMYIGEGDMERADVSNVEKNIFNTWNDVPSEMKEGILIPTYLPDEIELKEISIVIGKTYRYDIRYIHDDGKQEFECMRIAIKQYEEIKFQNEVTNPNAEFCGIEEIGNIVCYRYQVGQDNIFLFTSGKNLYYLYSSVSKEETEKVIKSME